MSITALNSAISGLKAAQKSLDNIATNIANASNTDYTRKILPQETQVIAGEGVGVSLGAVRRTVDKALLRDLMSQIGVSNNRETLQTFLSRVQSFHGASESNSSITAALSGLKDSFTQLSSAPDNVNNLTKTLTSARVLATKFNELSDMITRLRSETEEQIKSAVEAVNTALKKVAEANSLIESQNARGQSTAEAEDTRDAAMKVVAQFLEIRSFPTENGKVTVVTKDGYTLADTSARLLSFNRSTLLPTSYYGDGNVGGLFVDGPTGTDVTDHDIGGSIGALLQLRDQTLPTYQAQADELAQKLAHRMSSQGLTLFTDQDGNVPANVADPGAVGYVGFASKIQVNQDIIDDMTLLRSGTSGNTVLPGSNEVVRKVLQYGFGAYEYQKATGSTDISAGTLFSSLGVSKFARVIGDTKVTDITPTLAANSSIPVPSSFNLTVNGTLHAIAIGVGDTATDLVNTINTAFGSTIASINNLGQMVLTGNGNITLANVSLGAAGIAALGFSFGTTTADNPSFSVQVGLGAPVTIDIASTDTSTNLLAALNAVSGLSASLDGNGYLVLTPTEGGDIKLNNVIGTPLQALGMAITNVAHTAFRQAHLGPDATLSTGLLGNATLEDFGRSMLSAQGEQAADAKVNAEKEGAYLQVLDKRNSDVTGVNIDQELSDMIRVQSNYAAAAKMISATEKMIDTLLQAF